MMLSERYAQFVRACSYGPWVQWFWQDNAVLVIARL
jgi:hypothetical protein